MSVIGKNGLKIKQKAYKFELFSAWFSRRSHPYAAVFASILRTKDAFSSVLSADLTNTASVEKPQEKTLFYLNSTMENSILLSQTGNIDKL